MRGRILQSAAFGMGLGLMLAIGMAAAPKADAVQDRIRLTSPNGRNSVELFASDNCAGLMVDTQGSSLSANVLVWTDRGAATFGISGTDPNRTSYDACLGFDYRDGSQLFLSDDTNARFVTPKKGVGEPLLVDQKGNLRRAVPF